MTKDEYAEQIAQMSKTMFAYCLSRTNSYHDAEDLAQEILLISCKDGNTFPNEKAFYAFVWRTAENILNGWYRSRDRRNTAELDETYPDNQWERLAEQAQENEQLALMTRELALLNSNYRHVMVAYYIDGLSVRDISARFSLSQSMVKYLLFQSRKRIKEGITMDKNYGKLSYDPIELEIAFWGCCNHYLGKFDSKVRQNILMSCYYTKQTEEQIALQLGVPTAYLEDDLKVLIEHDLLQEKKGYYQTNVPIITKEVFDEISRVNKDSMKSIADSIRGKTEEMMEDVRALGFYGSDMPANSLKWMLVSLILRLAYIDMAHGEQPLDFPTDVFGDKCFRLFLEKTQRDPYSVGTSFNECDGGMILFWDVLINGERLHPRMTDSRADMVCRLLHAQPQTNIEKLVCSELVELGLAVRTEKGILPNFPCFTKEQGDKLNEMINGISWAICQDVISRTDNIRKILIDHSPAHLAEYVSRMAVLLHINETYLIMQNLCESGWLLPLKDGMSATTVMFTAD